MTIWIIGVMFSIGFTKYGYMPFSYSLAAKVFFSWPVMLGEELRDILKKDGDDEQN